MIDKLFQQIQNLRHNTQKVAEASRSIASQTRSTPKQGAARAQLRRICQDLEDRLMENETTTWLCKTPGNSPP